MSETYKKFKTFLWRPTFITGTSFSVAQGLWKGRKKDEDELCAEGPVTAVTSEDMDIAQDLMVDSGTDGR
jgi:hypothetical protein